MFVFTFTFDRKFICCKFFLEINKLLTYFTDYVRSTSLATSYHKIITNLRFVVICLSLQQGYSQALLSTTVLQKDWVFLNSAGGPGGAVSPPGRVQGLCPWKLWLFWLNWGLETRLWDKILTRRYTYYKQIFAPG